MSFWRNFGKIALTAAPYVAAPFTGGASLAFVPATTAALAAWNAHDAQQNAERGIAPSNFDRYLGIANGVAGMAYGSGAMPGSMTGASSAASGAANAAGGASEWQRALGVGTAVAPAVIGAAASRSGNQNQSSAGGGGGYTSSPTSSFAQNMGNNPKAAAANVMPQGGYDYNDNPMNQLNQRSPNLAQSIFQGRQEAIRNQPFRSGYDVNYLGSDDKTPLVSRTPSIFSSNDSPARTPPPEPELRSKEYTDPGGVKGSSDTGPAKPSKARVRGSARA